MGPGALVALTLPGPGARRRELRRSRSVLPAEEADGAPPRTVVDLDAGVVTLAVGPDPREGSSS